jgi:hypothetical protein
LIHPGNERSNVAIDVLDRGIGEVNVLQVKVQQETVMICHPNMECLAQFLSRSLDPVSSISRRSSKSSASKISRLSTTPFPLRCKTRSRRLSRTLRSSAMAPSAFPTCRT